MVTFTMGIDQNGKHYDDLGKYPRKELMRRLGYKKAGKMYVEKKDGSSLHIGYIVGPYWITLYELRRIEKPV
jgi:hypothetical protein